MQKGFTIISCIPLFFLTAHNGLQAQTCKPASIPPSTPDTQLLDHGDGTISDTKTGLMWKKCAEGLSGENCDTGSVLTFNWQQALEQPGIVNSSGFAGYTDWRLPNIKELTSIVEEQCSNPAIDINRFPGTPSSRFWSASACSSNSSVTWCVGFDYGYSTGNYRNDSLQVRLVRGGQ